MDNAMLTLVLLGCGGHSRSVADVALISGYKNLYFLDEHADENETILGYQVLSILPQHILNSSYHSIVAIGDNHKRSRLYSETLFHESLTTLISPRAYIGRGSQIGKGSFVAHDVHVGPLASIGVNCIINTHCLIEHEAQVGSHCHVSVNSTLAGRTKIGDFIMIGAGATVIDGVQICDNVIVGAGAVVTKDISEPGIYVGVPAKKL